MMEDDEEETCPLCMEPMDVTDQSASLCDCGYSMCLWCWHQIMENAAKDSLPARCPNCRSEYDKERITNATVDPEKCVFLSRSDAYLAAPHIQLFY
jgi:CCR4-NOT transcription complex subunit 4